MDIIAIASCSKTDGLTLNITLKLSRVVLVSNQLVASGANVSRSTQPCIPPGSLNRVPALAGVRVGMSPLPSGR